MTKSTIIKAASDHSVLVVFGEEVSPEHHKRVVQLTASLLPDVGKQLCNVHPAYSSVLVSFDPRVYPSAEIESFIRSRVISVSELPSLPSEQIEIPVCYGGEFGPDLKDVAALTNLSPDEVVHLHKTGEYLVYFLGFSPGFPYMGGLSPRLAVPRLGAPRKTIPAGSIAIGGRQTGIYPLSSPGGWRIIGRTPLQLFDPGKPEPALLKIGDKVRFHQITESEFHDMTRQAWDN